MGWTCPRPGCATEIETDEQKVCPACGEEKTAWTIRTDQTRTMVVPAARPRIECRRGEAHATASGAPRCCLGVAWRATKEISTIPKAEARRLAARGELPAPRDLLDVRLTPPPADPVSRLTVAIAFEESPVEERAYVLERRPDDLDEEGRLALRFLCVHGPGGLDGIAFPRIQTLDVSEQTELGHAPALELSGLRAKKPLALRLVAAEAAQVACSRGEAVLAASDGVGVAWRETTTASVLTVSEAAALRAAGRLPDPRHVLRVRLTPEAGRCALTLRAASRTMTVELAPAPEDLDEQGGLAASFVCVDGPGAELVRFPWLAAVDVTTAEVLEVDDGRARSLISLERHPPKGKTAKFSPVVPAEVRALAAAAPIVSPTMDPGDVLGLANTKKSDVLEPFKGDAVKDFLYVTEKLMISEATGYHDACTRALMKLYLTPTGNLLLRALRMTQKVVQIEGPDKQDPEMANSVVPTKSGGGANAGAERQADGRWKISQTPGWESTIQWQPNRERLGVGNHEDWRHVPPALLLGHELIHSWHAALGMFVDGNCTDTDPGDPKALVRVEELITVGLVRASGWDAHKVTENKLRAEWYDANPFDRSLGYPGGAAGAVLPTRPKYSVF